MTVYVFKTLHIIGFTAWFGGLFYLVRILVYHNEALTKASPEKRSILVPQYQLMEHRVAKIICQPAMMFTWACGLTMLALNPGYLQFGWLHTKLFFLVLLTAYHLFVVRLPAQLDRGKEFPDLYFRIMNEVPTIILAVIVGLAVFKTAINYYYLFGAIFLFIAMIAWGIVAYQKKRKKEEG